MANDLYINSRALKEEFSFYGNFYRNSKQVRDSFRNILSIVPKQGEIKESINFDDFKYDALFIMMNPGGSTPTAKNYKIRKQEYVSLLSNSLIKARPDQTQYQVCRVAKVFNWKAIAIINLSDIREAKSNEFLKRIPTLNKQFQQHSMFCKERESEFKQLINQLSDKTNVYAAWGLKTELSFQGLAEQALKQLNKFGIKPVGLSHPKIKTLYKHPLPMPHDKKLIWLKEIIAEIRTSKKKH